MAGMTAYVNFAGRYDQLIAQSRVAGAAAGGNVAAGFTGALRKFAAPVAIAGAATAAFKLGESFDKAYDKIRIGTGKTGTQLAGLKRDFKAVAGSGPADFDMVSTAITRLNQRLGLTGAPLQGMAKGVVRLSRLTKTDLETNIETVTRVFGDWGVRTDQQSGKLDVLFRASQATGTSVDRISGLMVKFGSPLRQLGFTFDQTAALAGKFEKEGVNTELVLGSMRVALGRMAREGEPAKETLARVTSQIKNAGSVSEANAMALELFGARAGPDMAAAIREGRFELGDLFDTVANGPDTLEKAGKATSSFSGKLQSLKNKVLVGLEPIAIRVFDGVGKAMDLVTPIAGNVAGAIGEVFSILFAGDFTGSGPFSEDSPIVDGLFRIRELVLGAADAVQTWLVPIFRTAGDIVDRVAGFLSDHAAVAFDALVGAIAAVVAPAVLPALIAGVGFLWGVLSGIVTALASPVVLLAALGAGLVIAYQKVEPFRNAVDGVASVIWGRLVGAWNWITDTAVPNLIWAFESVRFALSNGESNLGGWVGRLQDVALKVAGFVEKVRSIKWGDVLAGLQDRFQSSAVGDWTGDMANRIRGAVDDIDWGNVWSGITGGIGDAVTFLREVDWAGIFSGIRDFLQPAIDAAGELGSSLVELVAPVWDLTQALGTALAPVLRLVWPIVRTLGIALGVLGYISHKVFVFQLRAAAAVISWVADKILPALTWVITNVVAPVIAGLVEVILWAGTAIAQAATWLWNTVLQPVFNFIVGYITNVLIPGWRMIFEVVSTVFAGVWAAIQFAWGIVQPIFSAIVGFLRDQLEVRFNAFMFVAGVVWGAIQTAVGAAWDFIRPKFEAIVGFVEDHLIPIWSRISDAVGSAFGKVPSLIGDAIRRAGDVVAGFLRGAAGIARAVSLDSIADGLERAASAADRWGGLDIAIPTGSTPSGRPTVGAFAAGGFVPGPLSTVRDTVPAMLQTGEYVLTRKMTREAGLGFLERWRSGAQGFADGGLVGIAGDVWDATGGKVASSIADKLRDIGAGAVERVWPELPAGAFQTPVSGLLGMIPGGINHVRSKIIELIKGEAKRKEDALFAAPEGGWGAGAELAAGWIREAMAITGVPDWWFGHLMHRAKLESGFNPRAINLWDSNAAKGTPSMGLMQTIMPTFLAHALSGLGDIWNPVHNAVAAIRYILSRYGSILNTNPATGYALGGPVRGMPGLTVHQRTFDAGGVLEPGWNVVKNMTGAKEVLRRDSGGITQPLIGELHLHDDADVDHLLQGVSTRVMMGRL